MGTHAKPAPMMRRSLRPAMRHPGLMDPDQQAMPSMGALMRSRGYIPPLSDYPSPMGDFGPPMGGFGGGSLIDDTPIPGLVSSRTNSSDPLAKDSRLFVGNLNTIALSKEAVEAVFGRYGTVVGISMHKGYAFVQYSRPDEARIAGASEDGKPYAGQKLDINIVSQPKDRSNLKRSAGSSAGNPQAKRAKEANGLSRVAGNNAVNKNKRLQINTSANDVLVCEMKLHGLMELMDNKKINCTLQVSSGHPTDTSSGAYGIWSDIQSADDGCNCITEEIKEAVSQKTDQKYEKFEAMQYRCAQVNGQKLIIKIKVADDASCGCIHVSLFRSTDDGPCDLIDVLLDKPHADELVPFGVIQ